MQQILLTVTVDIACGAELTKRTKCARTKGFTHSAPNMYMVLGARAMLDALVHLDRPALERMRDAG